MLLDSNLDMMLFKPDDLSQIDLKSCLDGARCRKSVGLEWIVIPLARDFKENCEESYLCLMKCVGNTRHHASASEFMPLISVSNILLRLKLLEFAAAPHSVCVLATPHGGKLIHTSSPFALSQLDNQSISHKV